MLKIFSERTYDTKMRTWRFEKKRREQERRFLERQQRAYFWHASIEQLLSARIAASVFSFAKTALRGSSPTDTSQTKSFLPEDRESVLAAIRFIFAGNLDDAREESVKAILSEPPWVMPSFAPELESRRLEGLSESGCAGQIAFVKELDRDISMIACIWRSRLSELGAEFPGFEWRNIRQLECLSTMAQALGIDSDVKALLTGVPLVDIVPGDFVAPFEKQYEKAFREIIEEPESSED